MPAQQLALVKRAAPTITSEGTSGVEATSAVVEATVNPNGAKTDYSVEYGTTESYSSATTLGPLPYGDLIETVIPESGAPALTPETTYHYRITVTNVVAGKTETVHGADQTFTTLKAPSATGGAPASAPLTPAAAPAAPPSSTPPALIPFTTIAQYEAKEPKEAKTTTPKPLTKAQELAKALKACHAKKGKKRSSCEATARKKYGSTKKKGKK